MEPEGLKRQESTIATKFAEVKIEFKPAEQVKQWDSVSILGEFNQWLPEVMQRYNQQQINEDQNLDNMFYYRTRILKGYSYRYHFSVGKKFVVDETKESSQSRFGQMTNWVQAVNNEDEEELLEKKTSYHTGDYQPETEAPVAKRVVSNMSEEFEDYLQRHDEMKFECQELDQLAREARGM